MSSMGPIATLSPREYDAVLFDMDGVLPQTADIHAAATLRCGGVGRHRAVFRRVLAIASARNPRVPIRA